MIAESAMHSFADGELDDDMKWEVEAWLADHPGDRALVQDWRQQAHDLQAIFGPVLEDSIPRKIMKEVRRFPRKRPGGKTVPVFVALLLFGAGLIAGLFLAKNVPEVAAFDWSSVKEIAANVQSKLGF